MRFTITRPTARPRPSSYARLVMHLRDCGQTGGVIQTPLGKMRWGDQCEPWADPFEGRCCCGAPDCAPAAAYVGDQRSGRVETRGGKDHG